MACVTRRLHVAIVLLCAGCGVSDRSEEAGPGHADSAGVAIVRNADDPLLPRGELVHPARRVFGSETEGPELFGGGVGARLHPNGSLWISEAQTREIRVFDSGSGAHLFTIGGRGDGPGEFRRSVFLGFDGEGSAYVYDHEHRRLSVFSESGELLRSHLMPPSLGISPRPRHVTPAGTLLGHISGGLERMPVDGSTVRDTVRIWTMPLDGTAPVLVMETLGALWYFHDGTPVSVPFAGGPRLGFRDDRVYMVDNTGEVSYSVYGPAGLERRAEIDRAPLQVDAASRAMFLERIRRGGVPASHARIYEEHLSDMPIPDAQRHWDAVVVTDEGGAWLLRPGDPEPAMAGVPADDQVWDVFDAEGVLVGNIRLPVNVGPVQVSGQTALTVVRDELGRVTVAIHEVRWMG
ncbi:MAG: hypothetical protein F4139_00320 [Gemmatimonadetes bacterium]|nr:hypothetical protein [Gemmatimonadota bacterium]MYH51374.1 hypothetical protein [Gemmatimonadota bacterium]MYK66913.1 hypothetical protein [Gemmatimonadota bacterium]